MNRTKTGIILFLILISSPLAVFAQEKEDALLEYRRGNYKKAIEICTSELEVRPENMDSYVVMGWSHIKLGEYKSALEQGLKALEISRYDIRVIEIVGEAYYYLGKNLDALKYFEEYAVLAPTGDRVELAYYFMGEIFIRLGEYNHADLAFTTAVYHYPNSARWWSRLGYAREMAEDFRFSLEAYNRALQLNPSYSEAVRGKERVARKASAG